MFLKPTHPQRQLQSFCLWPCAYRTYHHRSATTTTRPSRTQAELTKDQDQLQLPRYIRRAVKRPPPTPAAAQEQTSTLKEREHRSSPKDTSHTTIHRSRHFDPSYERKPKPEIRLLEPHVLSARLKKLCDAGKIDDAVFMLKNAPLDAQNTPVWNTLIWECMKAKRFKLAYQLYVDMKRRGFSPTTRTFQTMFMGLSRIENWLNHTKQLENARSMYDSFQRHMTSVKKDDANSPELSVDPLAAYIRILGNAGHYQELFDIYYAMDTEGPLAPNKFIFTAIFQACSLSSKQDHNKTAADAKLLWNQMQKASRKSPGFQIDAILVTSALTALSRGRPTDQSFAFQIIRDYFGLTTPDDPPSTGTIPLAPQSFAAVLQLCNQSQRYHLCDHFLRQVKKRPEASGGASILDRAHLEEVLEARLSLKDSGSAPYCLELLEWMLREEITGRNGPKIRPALSTYNLVLTACWRDGDWRSAARTFDLMTGLHSHDFMDGAVSDTPRLDKRAPGRNLVPTAETLSTLVRTALASHNRANVRQCLRIVDYLGVDNIFSAKEMANDTKKFAKNRAFYASKLASAVIEAVANISGAGERASQDEVRRWKDLVNQAKEGIREVPTTEFIPTVKEEGTRARFTQYEKTL